MEQVAERAGISRSTLGAVEKGSSSVSLGAYMMVLFVLGLDDDILQLASDDVLGRKLQDAELLAGRRAPRQTPRRASQQAEKQAEHHTPRQLPRRR